MYLICYLLHISFKEHELFYTVPVGIEVSVINRMRELCCGHELLSTICSCYLLHA